MILQVLSAAGTVSTDTSRTTEGVSQSASLKVTPTKNWRSLDIGQERSRVGNWHLKKQTDSRLPEASVTLLSPVKGQNREQEVEKT